MSFLETHYLGEVTVFRTAADVARDIEQFGKDTKEMTESGGLRNLEAGFKYAAAKGRIVELKNAVAVHEAKFDELKSIVEMKVKELARLGVMTPAEIVQKIGTMGAAYMIPGIGWISFGLELIGVDIWGNKKRRQKKAEEIIRLLEELTEKANFHRDRIEKLNKEGETLAKAFDKGQDAFDVKLVGMPQKTAIQLTLQSKDKDNAPIYRVGKRTYDVKDTYLKVDSELEERAKFSTGARLPEGFQMLYSPALKSKAIVARTQSGEQRGEGPKLVTGQKLVFGGLAGVETQATTTMVIALAGMAWFAWMLATEPELRPVRRQMPSYRPQFYMK